MDVVEAALGQMYDLLIEGGELDDALSVLSHLLGDRRLVLMTRKTTTDPVSPIGFFFKDSHSFDDFFRDYTSHFHAYDTIALRFEFLQEGAWLLEDIQHDKRKWDSNYFLQEFILPQDVNGIATLKVSDSQLGNNRVDYSLNIVRDKNQIEFDTALMTQLGSRTTDLRRIFDIYGKFKSLRQLNSVYAEVISTLTHPAFVMTNDGSLILCNYAAEQHLASTHPVLQLSNSKLLASRSADVAAWDRLLNKIAVQADTLPFGIVLASANSPGTPVHCIPLRRATANAQPLYLIFFEDKEAAFHSQTANTLLAQMYGLTKIEMRIANDLANNLTIKELAEKSCREESTVRRQVKRILEKTGVRRQAELVGLITKLRWMTGSGA